MNYLEKIAPRYFEILYPLKRWRILSVKDLKVITGHTSSDSSFYKTISKLERNGLIESFMNSWSNEKFIYLLPEAIKAIGEERPSLPINKESRFHDAITTKVALQFRKLPYVTEVHLDQEIPKRFPLMERTPDILIEGVIKKPFRIAVEIELTQKSSTRTKEVFQCHANSKIVNNIIYITDKRTLFETYQRYLEETQDKIDCSKFIFIYEQELNRSNFNLLNSMAIYQGRETNLGQLLAG